MKLPANTPLPLTAHQRKMLVAKKTVRVDVVGRVMTAERQAQYWFFNASHNHSFGVQVCAHGLAWIGVKASRRLPSGDFQCDETETDSDDSDHSDERESDSDDEAIGGEDPSMSRRGSNDSAEFWHNLPNSGMSVVFRRKLSVLTQSHP